jgi:hypothetical protein
MQEQTMRTRISTLAHIVVFGLAWLIAPGTLRSQSLWLPQTDNESSVTLEVLKPDRYSGNPRFKSSVWFLSGQYRVSQRFTAVIELPVIYYTALASGGS